MTQLFSDQVLGAAPAIGAPDAGADLLRGMPGNADANGVHEWAEGGFFLAGGAAGLSKKKGEACLIHHKQLYIAALPLPYSSFHSSILFICGTIEA